MVAAPATAAVVTADDAALTVEHVSVTLGTRPVLRDVSLTLAPGEWLSVIGPNGAGKSTLLKAMAGLVPLAGSITLSASPTGRGSRRGRARLVAYVPQDPLIPEGMSVFEYVLLGRTAHLAYLAAESRSDLQVVEDVLAQLDLDGLGDRFLSTLSGGEQQRATLARALAQQAPLLLLDEPTSALDVGHQQQVLDLVESLRWAHGLSVVSAMHDLTQAGQFADRLLLLAEGRVVVTGPADAVLTEEALSRYWGARVRIVHDPDGGVVVIPMRSRPRLEE